MKKNVASQSIGAQMITAADGTIFTGAVSVLVTKDNGVQAAGLGTAPAHEGNGYHSYSPTQAETNADHIAFTFTGTGALTSTVQVYTTFPQTVDNNTILVTLPTQTYLDTRTLLTASYFDPNADTVANVALVATTTVNTDMRGTNSANTVAPDNSSIAAILLDTSTTLDTKLNNIQGATFSTTTDSLEALRNRGDSAWVTGATSPTVIQIRQEMDSNSTKLTSIVADTNELQGDWANGGRLDTILDSRMAETSINTTGGAVDVITTVTNRVTANTDQVAGSTVAATNLSKSTIAIEPGAAVTGTLSTTTMTTNLTELTDDHYIGRTIIWTSGTLKNQATDITDYIGLSKTLVYTATTDAPSNNDTFVIV